MKKGILCAIAVVMGMAAAAQETHLQVYNSNGTLTHSIPLSQIDCYKIEAYESVDLDLPSGTLWATFNVGATAPHETGNYYAWGETVTKTDYSINASTYNQNISDISGNATYDAATANWGNSWCIPTNAQAQELATECQWEETTINGVTCHKVTGPNGKYIYLPCAGVYKGTTGTSVGSIGRYWTSTPGSKTSQAYSLNFPLSSTITTAENRNSGRSIRPVTSSKSNNAFNFMNIKFANGQTRSIPVDNGLNAVNISGNRLNVSYTYDTTGKFYEINQIDQITFSNDAKDEDIITSVESLNGTNAISINHDNQSIKVKATQRLKHILIFNAQGKLMTQIAPNVIEASVSIANFPAGMYIIKAMGSENSKIQKIIKH